MMKNERTFGYAFEDERVDEINGEGMDPDLVLRTMKSAFPEFNAYAQPWNMLDWQAMQGACAGHALGHMTQIIGVQKFGVQRRFSRACGYYEACLLYTSPSPRDATLSRMPSSA